ncbi:unnamed protein product [Amoebophrya sp. A120]|nr:unnamed protein product [Amoebophrya sp. A120]|eukprot:GSA120T00024157001.1
MSTDTSTDPAPEVANPEDSAASASAAPPQLVQELASAGTTTPAAPAAASATTPALEEAKSKMKKIVIIYNPYGGKKKGKKLHDETKKKLLEKLDTEKYEILSYETQRANHGFEMCASEIPDEILQSEDLAVLVVIGGDGSLNECLNGLATREKVRLNLDSVANVESIKQKICLIPGGTGNALATDLGIVGYSTDKLTKKRTYRYAGNAINAFLESSASQTLDAGEPKWIDLGAITYQTGPSVADATSSQEPSTNVKLMHNMLGLGLGVDANIKAERWRCCGPLRYDWSILLEICRIDTSKGPTQVIKYQDKSKNPSAGEKKSGEIKFEKGITLALVQNTKVVGDKLNTAPYAEVDDGLLDAVTGPKLGCCATLGLFNKVKKNGQHVNDKRVGYEKVTDWSFESSEPARLNIDGENIGYTPCKIVVKPKFFQIYTF